MIKKKNWRDYYIVEQESPTLPENLSSPHIFSGVCVVQS